MNIYDLPIVTDETMVNKTIARIHENKIVCHPDLVEKVKEGMGLMRASAKGFDRDMAEMAMPKKIKMEKENEKKSP